MSLFKNPTNEYRGKPFWSWNGRLQKDELIRQIHIFKQMGMGGFFMHSRVGLKTEYLSDEWFELINACTDEAKKFGLEAWLYDEDRWPSGSCGGIVTQNKSNRMKFILMHIDDEIKDENKIVYSCKCMVDNNNLYFNSNENTLWFEIVEFPESGFYNGNTYADTLKLETTKEYLHSTHEKYKEKCSEIGKTIKGIFTDEPHRGEVMCDMRFNGYAVPYTEKLFEVFYRMWKYDLRDKLPELFLKLNGQEVSQVRWHYMETVQQMFIDNFAKPIQDWCSENNLLFTGHVWHEDSLTAQTIAQGSLMRFYEYMDYPGIDVLTEKNDNYCIAKQLYSVGNQLGKEWLLSELYGCTGWQMNFTGHKNIGDWQALMGINVRCHHLSWYTMAGECKRDYPASILHQSAWYKEYKYVEDYFSRISVFLSRKESVNDTLVISPVESVWCQIYVSFSEWCKAKSESVLNLEEHYKKLYNMLFSKNVLFDFGDEEMLSRLYSIEADNLFLGKAKYKKVIISGMLTIRETTLKILNEFAKNGGEVLVIGGKPQYINAQKSDVNLQAKFLPFNEKSVENLSNNIVVADNDSIFIEVRKEEENYYIMMLNIDRENEKNTKVNLKVNGNIEKWCARTGEKYSIDSIDALHFEPGEEKLFVIRKQNKNLPKEVEYSYCDKKLLDNIVDYSLGEPNICVLEYAKCRLDNEILKEKSTLKIDRELREKFGLQLRGGEMNQPWYNEKFISEDYFKPLGKISLDYEFYAEFLCDMQVALEDAQKICVKVNDNILDKTAMGKWIDICFDTIKIPKEFLVEGKNIITLELEFSQSSDIENVYLLGDFGVRLENNIKTIVKLPKNISFGDLKQYDLPFYSGEITYKFNTGIKGSGQVKFDDLCGSACIKVNKKIIAFAPYEVRVEDLENIEIILVLTRQNTFGELHNPNKIEYHGPWEFISDYEVEDYILNVQGLKKPKILLEREKK